MEEVHRQYGSVTRGHHQVADMEAQDINTLGFPLPSGHRPYVYTAPLEARTESWTNKEYGHRKCTPEHKLSLLVIHLQNPLF